tara:strand:- start:4441 stop:4641 length:201 start_codon:yes stop_codon:yes gene_type:complete
MKNLKKKFYEKQINLIKKTRQKNNNNWMDLMKVAFRSNPRETKKIIKKIFQSDKKINKIVKNLIKD